MNESLSKNHITLNFHQISIILMQTVTLYYMIVNIPKKPYVLKIVTMEKEGGDKKYRVSILYQLIFLRYLLLLFTLICIYI